MIQGQAVMEKLIRLLSVKGQPTKAVLAQACMGALLIRSMSDKTCAMIFLQKPTRTTWRSVDHSLRNSDLVNEQ
jgi:hypothetical protein